ncbi:hypothetical protein [Radicibacter daui]|uniref:hypothetical protein n=1 Tax=Radicibacter daui TaxID=3064829 RepID=UPI004046A2EC
MSMDGRKLHILPQTSLREGQAHGPHQHRSSATASAPEVLNTDASPKTAPEVTGTSSGLSDTDRSIINTGQHVRSAV